jgi:hypothetical protein
MATDPVSRLLIGATIACGVAPAEAADVPLRVSAAEQVRLCGHHGIGYAAIPGTDTCIKLGGYVRYEDYHNAAGGTYPTTTPQGVMNRATATLATQARFRLTADLRTQTNYGTLRSYIAFGVNWLNNPGGALQSTPGAGNFTPALERAFVQFAGFTIGRVDTFFAFYNSPAYNFLTFSFDGSSGTTGVNVFAYTQEFGNGLKATLSLEDQIAHSAPVIDLGRANAVTATAGVMGAGLFAQPGPPFSDMRGQWVPDIIANLRLDRHWGAVQVKGALHRTGGGYNFAGTAQAGRCTIPDTTGCGHPADAWGWATGFGLTLKMPWDARDTLSGVIAYAEGASTYVAFSQANNSLHGARGLALGPFTDAVFGAAGADAQSDLLLTRALGGTVAFEHYWAQMLRTSFVFGYLDIAYSNAAKAQIANLGRRCALGGTAATAFTVRDNCDPDWSAWRIASRTMWTPIANLDIGIEVGYSRITSAFSGEASIPPGAANPNGTGLSAGRYDIRDDGVWSATFRVQRSFWP